MNSAEALFKLRSTCHRALRTADASALLGISLDRASHLLSGLTAAGHLVKLKRGLWMFRDECRDPLVVAAHLTAPFPCYVSLQTALYRHGMISQMPVVVYVVSPGRTKLFKTPAGTYSIHHLATDFFFGFERDEETGAAMAVPEKALLDFFYFSPARSGWFSALPELDLSGKFSLATARKMIAKVASIRRRTIIEKKLEMAVGAAGRETVRRGAQ